MDLYEAIRALHEEKQRIDRLIAVLEELERAADRHPAASKKRRGRKTMSAEERREVSERMKRYWARRKQPEQAGVADPAAPASHSDPAGD
jgi:hypothetical protein